MQLQCPLAHAANDASQSRTGLVATCYAFYRAYKSMKARDSIELNKMFRARIYAQAFTLVAMVGGGLYYADERKRRRELEQQLNEKKSQEKRDAWLRELEIRDQEDREWRERHAAIGKAAKAAETKDLTAGQKKTDGNKKSESGEEKKRRVEDGAAGSAAEEDSSERKEKGAILDAVKALLRGEK